MSCSVELRQPRQQEMAEDPHKLVAIMNKFQRLLLGHSVLLLVDIIWVCSSELTKYIYQEAAFNKPFFSTYIITSMFTLYLLGLCFWPPWQDQCNEPTTYMFIDPNVEDDNFYSKGSANLTDPTFVPIKTTEQYDRSPGTESDDSSVSSVRFSKLAEVRHMSENDATKALLIRLSYQASVRAGEHARRQANKFSVQKVDKIALMFCFLWFIAIYTYQMSLAETEAAIVTVLSSSSNLFTLFLAGFFSSNSGVKFTLSKLVAITISIFGLVLAGLSDLAIEVSPVFTVPNLLASPVIGGHEDTFNTYSYHVSILHELERRDPRSGTLLCGGAIIHDRYVLTAAHCFMSKIDGRIEETVQPETVIVVAATTETYGPGIIADIVKIFIPRAYDLGREKYGDIAIVKLAVDLYVVPNADRLQILRLDPGRPLIAYENKEALVFGNGCVALRRGDDGVLNPEPNRVAARRHFLKVHMLPRSVTSHYFDHTIIAFNTDTSEIRACVEGDSGSPLVYDNTIIGVLSQAPVTLQEGELNLMMFTRVYRFINFINNAVNGNNRNMHILDG